MMLNEMFIFAFFVLMTMHGQQWHDHCTCDYRLCVIYAYLRTAPKGRTKAQYDSAYRKHFLPWLKLANWADEPLDSIFLQFDPTTKLWTPNQNTFMRFAFHLWEVHATPAIFKSVMSSLYNHLNRHLLMKGMPEKDPGYLYNLTAVRDVSKNLRDYKRTSGILNCEDIQVMFIYIHHFAS